MIEKTFDLVVLGENYLSYFYAFKKLKEGKSVLVIDDERINLGHSLLSSFGQFEKIILDDWCERLNIENFLNHGDVLRPTGKIIQVQDELLKLGSHSASLNLNELLRKYPILFENNNNDFYNIIRNRELSELFDKQYTEYLYFLRNIFLENRFETPSIEKYLIEAMPYELKNIFLSFIDKIDNIPNSPISWNDEHWSNMTLIYSLQGPLHFRLSLNVDFIQKLHLFLHLLGQTYRLDENKLKLKAKEKFLHEGGICKKSDIKSWTFYKSMPWCIELASFEGIIHPKVMAYFGSLPKDSLPLEIKTNHTIHRVVHLSAPLEANSLITMDNESDLLFIDKEQISTDLSLWQISINEKEINVKALVKHGHCKKLDFLKNKIIKKLNRVLEEILQGQFDLQWSIGWGDDVFINDINSSKTKKVKSIMYDYSNPSNKSPLKLFEDFGPISNVNIGLLSCLGKMNTNEFG